MLGMEEIARRFGSTAEPPQGTAHNHSQLTGVFVELAKILDEDLEDGREKSVVFTHLEEASMWAHKSLANTLSGKAEPSKPAYQTVADPTATVEYTSEYKDV